MIKLLHKLLYKKIDTIKPKKDNDPYLYEVLEIQNEKYNS